MPEISAEQTRERRSIRGAFFQDADVLAKEVDVVERAHEAGDDLRGVAGADVLHGEVGGDEGGAAVHEAGV